MANINLLPWREAQREERKRQFLGILLGTLILGVLVGFGADRFVNHRIEVQNGRNEFIQAGIRELDRKVAEIRQLKERKQDMLNRMEVIQGLQNSRPETVRMFDEFVRVLPDGAFIRVVVGKGNTLSIEGTSESNNRISAYMRNLDSSPKFDGPNLTKVVADDVLGEQGSEFNMSVGVVAKSLDRTDVNADEEASPENGN